MLGKALATVAELRESEAGVRSGRFGGVFLANASVCFAPAGEEPGSEALEHSAPVLKALLGAVRPRVVVACGAQAASWTLGKPRTRIEQMRGSWWKPAFSVAPWRSAVWPVMVRVSYHPLYVLREEARRMPKARKDFRAVGELLSGSGR